MAIEESDWPAILRALDEPARPSYEVPTPGLGQGNGIVTPHVFDFTAAENRFDRLVERLEEAFGQPCAVDGVPRSACFSGVWIPAEATRTRAKRTRDPCGLAVLVSSFGDLATYRPFNTWGQVAPVHPDDQLRIEEALDAVGYLFAPMDVLDTPYDGPNEWIFGQVPDAKPDPTWFDRFFDTF